MPCLAPSHKDLLGTVHVTTAALNGHHHVVPLRLPWMSIIDSDGNQLLLLKGMSRDRSIRLLVLNFGEM